jgi:hypothetical protein
MPGLDATPARSDEPHNNALNLTSGASENGRRSQVNAVLDRRWERGMSTATKDELAGARRLLRRINQYRPEPEQMKAFAKACGKLPRRLRTFEGHAIMSAEYFPGDMDRGQSAFFRMAALARTVSAHPLPGWTKPTRQKGALLTLEVLFAAAADAKVVLRDGEMVFDRPSLLKRAFQLAKRMERE